MQRSQLVKVLMFEFGGISKADMTSGFGRDWGWGMWGDGAKE
jgi:hypothetical protein